MDYLYPTQADHGREWVRDMLDEWKSSGKRQLCFSFVKFHPHTLNALPAWMYMYYRAFETDAEHLRGRIRYRLHVTSIATSPDNKSPFVGDDIFTFRFDWNRDKTLWLKCDQAEQIQLLDLGCFTHPEGKRLASALRSSIAQARLDPKVPVVVVRTFR